MRSRPREKMRSQDCVRRRAAGKMHESRKTKKMRSRPREKCVLDDQQKMRSRPRKKWGSKLRGNYSRFLKDNLSRVEKCVELKTAWKI